MFEPKHKDNRIRFGVIYVTLDLFDNLSQCKMKDEKMKTKTQNYNSFKSTQKPWLS